MASFNPCLPIERWTHEVFLSFRGEDTRNNFVDHLHVALTQRGLHTFKDDDLLVRGKSISPELMKAIEESGCAVIVFSVNYANSSWCLDELVKIMECRRLLGQRVLPVFYYVDPSDLRNQKGSFGTAFHLLEEKFRGEPEKVNKWRESLIAASNISGFHFSTSDGGESEFINKIVLDILGNIKPHGTQNNLIGIEPHMDTLMSLLDTQATEQVRIVGIWGMGGIGKTTIAQAIFRRIAFKFDRSCFVKDVRENSSNKKDLCSLQFKILKDLQVKYPYPDDPDEGAEVIQKTLSNKKVLLVLDDVDNEKQLKFLAASHEWFCPGSRIIITTRNEHLLSYADEKYKPGLLLMNQAIQLFSRHAFKKEHPPEIYEDVSYRVISYAKGLPLALQVLGSFFHGRRADVWHSALNRLEKEPNIEIFETLMISFDGLDDSEKKIFLDIACFFKGKEMEHVIRILDSFGFDPVIGISVLIEKSLITISKEKIEMHDLIQEMGWKIVRVSFSNSRIWQLGEMLDLIVRKKKLKAIEAIVLQEEYDEKLGSTTNMFGRMKNLRLLDIYSKLSSDKPNFLLDCVRATRDRFFNQKEFPYELRWICWHGYPFFTLPIERLHKLVGLEMVNNTIHHLWKGKKILPSLKYIDLRESKYITSFPDISGAPNIERLILSECKKLVKFHESLGFHRRLKYFEVRRYSQLECLPSMIKMESLETLILSECRSLKILPEVSSCMVKLSKIYIDECCELKELPSSIGFLSGLSLLKVISCDNLKNVPNSICKLTNLKSLHFYKCQRLQKLPEDIGSMENLEELLLGLSMRTTTAISIPNVTSWFSLRKLDLSRREITEEDFPNNFHQFSSLEELYLIGNTKLMQLPAGLSNLSRLKFLDLTGCEGLQNLHGLPSQIQVLKATSCSSLEKIGDLTEEYEWLYKIWLINCYKLLHYQDNRKYIDKMMQQTFLKKCAALDHRLSIGIPGSNVPSWFKEQCHGCSIALKLPPKCHTQIMGFAVCGVFHGNWYPGFTYPRIIFKILNDEKAIMTSKVDFGMAGSIVSDNRNVWISYIPFGFFKKMYHDMQPEDWALIEGNLDITVKTIDGSKSERCGASIVYKEDLQSIQHNRNCILDYGKLVHINGDNYQEVVDYDARVSGNTYVYEEESSDENLNPMSPRTRMPNNDITERSISLIVPQMQSARVNISDEG